MRWCAGAALAVAAVPGWAQQPPGETTLRPVTITATPGIAQAAFDTPASIDVIEGEVLHSGQLQVNLSEALQRVPGVVAFNRQNYAQDLQISSRGYGARSTFGVRGLRLYADGIPATGPDGQGQVSHFDLASAQRVEVLRGPFSALYGNSSGGVISIFTADGGPDTVADVSTAFGSGGVRRATVQLSGQEGRARWRISSTRFETDGSREHSAAQRDSLNGKLRIDASEDTRLTLVLNSVRLPDTQDPLGLGRAELQANPRQATASALAFDTRKSVDQLQGGLLAEHRIDRANSVQLSVYAGQRSTEQFLAIPVAVQTPPSHPGAVVDLDRRYQGLDVRWVHKASPLTLTAGLAYETAQEERRGYRNFIGTQLGVQGALRRDESNSARSLAPYAQAQWTISPRWSLSAGLRHSRVRFDARDHYLTAGNGDDSGQVRYAATTPAAGIVFHASDTLNVYAALGRGFETPTLNELAYRADGTAGLNAALRAASSRQWELGTKWEGASGWRANAAVFEARTRNELVVQANSGGRTSYTNAASTSRRGAELAAGGALGAGFSAQLAATVLEARYRGGGAIAGNRMPGIPGHTLFGELAWQHRPWGPQAALEWRRTGRIAVDDANSDFAGAAQQLNARVVLRQEKDRWTFSEFARVDNIGDRKLVGSVIVNDSNRRFFEPAPGRTWLAGVSAAYRF